MALARLPRRLVSVLGAELDALTEAHLQRLVGLREGDELEAKSAAYGKTDADRRELAADVVAFANARGGLLVVGADDVDDEITTLVPLELAGEDLRIRQILANTVVPHLDVAIRHVPSSVQGAGYLLVVVPASVRAPHAVMANNDFRYAVRDGPGKRPIREPELADRFRGRFAGFTARSQRLDDVHRDMRQRVEVDDIHAWLVLSTAADQPGDLPIGYREAAEARQWFTATTRRTPWRTWLSTAIQETVGVRRLVVGDYQLLESGRAKFVAAELHADGSAGVAVVVGRRVAREGETDPEGPASIEDETLALSVLGLLHLAANHAERAGAAGDLLVSASLVGPLLYGTDTGFQLVQQRQFFRDQVAGTRVITNPALEAYTHTLPIDALRSEGPDLVAATHLVARDITSAFGLAEPLQFTVDGRIRRYFKAEMAKPVGAWATEFDVEVTDETLP